MFAFFNNLLVLLLALYSELSGNTVPPRIYEVAVIVAVFQAMFLAWLKEETARINVEKELADCRTINETRRIKERTIEALTSLMTQSGDLFAAGQALSGSQDLNVWNGEFNAWFERTYETVKTNISEAEAALFREVPGGSLVMHYWGEREHNQRLNMLRGYQENLRHLIERYSDR